MSSNDHSETWLPLRSKRTSSGQRLFCFPHAGGAAAAFRTWSQELGSAVEVCAVEYPGRWSRHREPPFDQVDALVAAALEGMRGDFQGRFAFFAYSFGTLVAFELARALRRAGLPTPEAFIVGARQAPHLPSKKPPIHTLPEAQFLDAIDRRYGILPPSLRTDPDMLQLVVRILRSDMTALETYVYTDDDPLPCPITAMAGTEDRTVDWTDLQAWASHTTGHFESHSVSGDHFFLNSNGTRVLEIVRSALFGGSPSQPAIGGHPEQAP